MPTLTTFLTYPERAEEAVELYTSIFPDSEVLETTRYGPAGPGTPGSVMTLRFRLLGEELVALNGGPSFEFAQGFSLLVTCDTQEEVDAYWDALAAEGREVACGWVTDKFGVSWQIIPKLLMELITDADPAAAQRVMQAMLKMTKIETDELLEAYNAAA